MIIGHGEVIDGPDDNLAVLDHRAILGRMHAEDGRLRRVDDWRRQHRAEGAAVGNGEGSAGKIFDGQLAVLRLLAKFGDFLFDVGEGHLLTIAQHGNDEAARRPDGNADIKVAVVDDVIAIDAGVNHREFFQRVHCRLDKEGHETEFHAVFFLEAVLVLCAHLHNRGHVDLVEGGEDGRGRLRLHQALGDARTQTRHRHALLGAAGENGIDTHRRRGLRQRGSGLEGRCS